ncbi:TPA: hypothetical protein I7743_21920 [Vibrio vulnificus]|nr:hypothetical protein [Vibrio vulnificus]
MIVKESWKTGRSYLSACKTNKAFKSDSQRLAVSLRSSIAKRRSHLNAALSIKKIVLSKLLWD